MGDTTVPLQMGTSLRYPITISKIYVAEKSKINKGDVVFQYTSEYDYETGDPLREVKLKTEKRKLISEYASLNDATIESLNISEGMVLEKDCIWAHVQEECSHEVQFQGLCVQCGKDMAQITYLSNIADSKRAQISMVHNDPGLKVSHTFASGVQVERQRKLLKDRKLSLVVDLDMTILQAVCDPTVGEWMNDPSNPNYSVLQDVRKFTLSDGPHTWYYVKLRNGLDQFLERISDLYEMHIYTMGTRAYANEIAKLIDPQRKLFGDRIISRDENGSMHKKSLERLFPVSQRMVAIIDDRMDVWEFNLPHLVKVHPYDFFVGLGDIHASFLPKLDPVPAADPPKESITAVKEPEAIKDASPDEKSATPEATTATKVVVDDKATLEAQIAEEEKQLASQLEERPLLQSQQRLDSEADGNGESNEEKSNGDKGLSHGKALLRDDDTELWSLADNLAFVHKVFYDEYDLKLKSAEEVGQAGRVQQIKQVQKKRKAPGSHLRQEIKEKEAPKDHADDLKVVPDVGEIMPRLKSKTLAGCKVVLSGLVPLGVNLFSSMMARELQSFGAEVQADVDKKTTHVVVSNLRARTQKVRKALGIPHIKVVGYGWLQQSYKEWKRANEADYVIENYLPAPLERSYNLDDSDEEDDGDINARGGGDANEPSGSQETSRTDSEYDYDEDIDGILPDDAHSPIEDLKTFNWGEADDELADFLGSDADDDSEMDGESEDGDESMDDVDSTERSKKRKSGDISSDTEDKENSSDAEDMNAMSKTAKKQRRARIRSSGLKSVKYADESGLPTPDVTGGEDGDADVYGGEGGTQENGSIGTGIGGLDSQDDDLENMLENEMFAELMNGQPEDQAGG